jgi:sulfite reductase (ferredoxin)
MSTQTHASVAPPDRAPAAPAKRSAVEGIKENSQQLRGRIGLELLDDTDHFSEQDKQLLKFHGTYQQEDRDARKRRSKEGVGKHYMFMVRCKIPGGRLTAKQYLAVDALADAYANGTLRFTTRQGIQLHGVLKKNLKETIAGINRCLLTTLGACGDVERNVMACPAPHHHDGVHAQLQETARILAAQLAPRSRAYHEIWLNGKPVCQEEAEREAPIGERSEESAALPHNTTEEPLYGKTYLPRKFKTGLALPEDNCIDVYAQDLGLLAIVENGTIVGYNVLVGGGMGMTHGNQQTFPHVARPICYVPVGAVVGTAEAIVRLFREHGNRADRKRARIKYLVHDWGVARFREVLAGYIGGTLQEPRPVEVSGVEPHLGWHSQGDGKWYYGISIENGRVKDEDSFRLRSALRSLIECLEPGIRLTPMQDILLCDLDGSAKEKIERTLADFGIRRPDQLSTVQKFSLACPAIPTCGLAISESERSLPGIIDQLEAELKQLGLEEEKLSVRMTGCPNGCARPYQSEIGLVGRSGDKYTIYLGGHVLGHRLNFLFKDLVPLPDIVPTLRPLLRSFKDERHPKEGFGDYCQRQGLERLQALLSQQSKELVQSSCGGNHRNGTAHLATKGVKKDDRPEVEAPAAAVSKTSSPPDAEVRSPAPPEAAASPPPSAGQEPLKQSERFLVGLPSEERTDYVYRYNTDGSVRETVVYYYGDECRAAAAGTGQPLRREASYHGRVDPYRLYNAPKRSDTYYIGSPGHERKDVQVAYHADGRVAQTSLFYYDDNVRASDAPSGSAVRRAVTYETSPNDLQILPES